MDLATKHILEQNPEFDRVVAVLVRLLLESKAAGAHGKTGVKVEHKPGHFGLIHEIREHTVMR